MPPPRSGRRASVRRCWPRCSPPRSSRRAASPASRSPRPRRDCRRIPATPRWQRQSGAGRTHPPTCPTCTAGATNSPRRSDRARPRHPTPAVADLDKQISDAQAVLADADAALQAASPNYGQLVQQVVPASDVFAALHPDEAFAAIALSREDGWVFLLRNGAIDSVQDRCRPRSGRGAGAPCAGRHRADFERSADLRYRRCAEAVPTHHRWRRELARRGEVAGRGAYRPICCPCRSKCC